MLETYLAAAALVAASFAVGGAIAKACGREPWSGYAPATGLAALIVVATVAIKLPGDGTAAATVLLAVTLAGAAFVARDLRRPAPELVLAGLGVLLLASIPFLGAERVDLLGVGINNDTGFHLSWTEALRTGSETLPAAPPRGYPLGDHALLAGLTELGVETPRALNALLIAVPLLTVMAAASALEGLSRPRRALAAVLVALPYLAASYYAQAAFKETIEALFLLALVVLGRELLAERVRVRGVLLAGVLLAGCFYNYSYIGFAWPVAAVVGWGALALLVSGRLWQPRSLLRAARRRLRVGRRAALAGLGALALLALVLAPELSRAGDFFDIVKFSPSDSGVIGTANLGNLLDQISQYQVLGLWPREDFRDYFDHARDAYRAGLLGALGVLAAVYGAAWWVRRRDLAVPGAVGAGLLIYLYLRQGQSAYVTAKSLAVLAPLTMLLMIRPLLAPRRAGGGEPPYARAALAGLFVAGALLSSVMALRGGLVWGSEHREQIESLRPLTKGRAALFLGRQDHAQWELRGTPVSDKTIRTRVPAATRPEKNGQDLVRKSPYKFTFDFDTIASVNLTRFAHVITTATAYSSEPPPNFSLVRDTGSFWLFRRSGPTPPRAVLSTEGGAPGAVLDCSTSEGRRLRREVGFARVRPQPVRAKPRLTIVRVDETARRRLWLTPGRWELSVQYVGQHPVEVDADGQRLGVLPESSDREGPFWRIGQLDVTRATRVEVDLTPPAPNLVSSRFRPVTFGDLVAVRVDEPARTIPLSRACGRYVDWYTLGPERPRAGRLPS